ncbi:MAG: hypothetical protein ABIK28_22520, partial [Planctomycetota bacterium]
MIKIRFPGSCLPVQIVVFSFCILLSSWGCSTTEGELNSKPATDFERKLETNLERAGENSAEIQAFLDAYPEGEKNAAARFLVVNLPVTDLASMTCDDLKENLDCAFRVRESLPWGRTPSFNLFLHYVLP